VCLVVMPSPIEAAAEWADQQAAGGAEVFLSMNPRAHEGKGKDAVTRVTACYVDLDLPEGETVESGLEQLTAEGESGSAGAEVGSQGAPSRKSEAATGSPSDRNGNTRAQWEEHEPITGSGNVELDVLEAEGGSTSELQPEAPASIGSTTEGRRPEVGSRDSRSEGFPQGDSEPAAAPIDTESAGAGLAELVQVLRAERERTAELERERAQLYGQVGYLQGELEATRQQMRLLQAPAPGTIDHESTAATVPAPGILRRFLRRLSQ
jgi:hypothetical protein